MPRPNTDKPPAIDSDLLQKARETLHDFFDKKTQRTSLDISTARIATSLLATHARERQAAGAADALSFMIARELSSDKAQLEQFLTAAMPSAPIVKALPTRKDS
jgi:hypothetical protein